MSEVVLVGRSSSQFTRVTRVFALELGVPFAFRPVLNLTSLDANDFGGNPALKMPVLLDERGPLFGTENVCRELVRRSNGRDVVMRGESSERVVANVEELALHVMAADVVVVTTGLAGSSPPPKVLPSIEQSLRYLDEHVDRLHAALPERRALSFVEVALFCAVTHLTFRNVIDVAPYARLVAFCDRFAARPSARATEYRFD